MRSSKVIRVAGHCTMLYLFAFLTVTMTEMDYRCGEAEKQPESRRRYLGPFQLILYAYEIAETGKKPHGFELDKHSVGDSLIAVKSKHDGPILT
jgi:hypothetical protein